MRRLCYFVLSVSVGGVCIFASPQKAGVPPVLSITTDLVTLAVTVIDRHGAFVAGLRSEHFTVYDNGEPRPIEFFGAEDLPATIGLVIDSSGGRSATRCAQPTRRDLRPRRLPYGQCPPRLLRRLQPRLLRILHDAAPFTSRGRGQRFRLRLCLPLEMASAPGAGPS